MRLWVVALAAALGGCGGVVRIAYNHGDFALRMMANEYLDLQGEQQDLLKAQLARFHEWHRREELPLYAGIFQGAADRLAPGLKREDVTWAFGAVRARYRVFMLQAADESAPVMATLKPDNYAALAKKFADTNAKFTKEYLGPDQVKRDRARAKWLVERFEFFMGDLTDAQVALLERFVQSQPRINEVRLTDRKRRQQEFVELLQAYQTSPELAERLRGYFVNWESGRGREHAKYAREWEERLVQLVLDVDATLTPEQRQRVVARFEGFAEDCRVLARQGRPSGTTAALPVGPELRASLP
jgi:ribosomal protein S18